MGGPRRFTALVPEPRDPRADNRLKYEEDFCWQVRVMAQEGKFPEEWCAHIGITMSTLYNWANAYPEFERACLESWYVLRAFWSRKAREAKTGDGQMPPTILLQILMKRFPDTWGKHPINTQETFENRSGRKTDDEVEREFSPEAIRGMSPEDIQTRIKTLMARRNHEGAANGNDGEGKTPPADKPDPAAGGEEG